MKWFSPTNYHNSRGYADDAPVEAIAHRTTIDLARLADLARRMFKALSTPPTRPGAPSVTLNMGIARGYMMLGAADDAEPSKPDAAPWPISRRDNAPPKQRSSKTCAGDFSGSPKGR